MQADNGYIVHGPDNDVNVFIKFADLTQYLFGKFKVEGLAATEKPPNMDIAKSRLKYAKQDCCDNGKPPCIHKLEIKDVVSLDKTKLLCGHSCFAHKPNDEAFEAIYKPCHGGYQPKE